MLGRDADLGQVRAAGALRDIAKQHPEFCLHHGCRRLVKCQSPQRTRRRLTTSSRISAKLGLVTVPHPKKDLSIGTLKSIEKQAGIRLR